MGLLLVWCSAACGQGTQGNTTPRVQNEVERAEQVVVDRTADGSRDGPREVDGSAGSGGAGPLEVDGSAGSGGAGPLEVGGSAGNGDAGRREVDGSARGEGGAEPEPCPDGEYRIEMCLTGGMPRRTADGRVVANRSCGTSCSPEPPSGGRSIRCVSTGPRSYRCEGYAP